MKRDAAVAQALMFRFHPAGEPCLFLVLFLGFERSPGHFRQTQHFALTGWIYFQFVPGGYFSITVR
jgi:hypothetical protein